MTIDIITALDQAFFQAETAQNDQVRAQAIRHFINVAGIMEQQLKAGSIVAIKCDFAPEDLERLQAAQQQAPKPVRTYQTGVRGLGDPGLQWTPPAASEKPVPPAPDVIDMTDPRNWQVGDVIRRTAPTMSDHYFTAGAEYPVVGKNENCVQVANNNGYATSFPFSQVGYRSASNFFTWLRHGDASPQA